MAKSDAKFANEYGAKVKEFRNLRNLSQEKLAELCNCSGQTISGIEIGYNTPSFGTMEAIAKALDVPLKYFFNFEKSNQDEKDFIILDLYKKLPETDKLVIEKIIYGLTEYNYSHK